MFEVLLAMLIHIPTVPTVPMIDFQNLLETAVEGPENGVRGKGYIPPRNAIKLHYRLNRCRRAFLDVIAFAEGTYEAGMDGYRMQFGGGLIDSLYEHPNQVIEIGKYRSTATGRYQFLYSTWKRAAKALGLTDFGPESQDQAALYLIAKRDAMHLVDSCQLTQKLIWKLAPEWASFPSVNGRSYYLQPFKKYDELFDFWKDL